MVPLLFRGSGLQETGHRAALAQVPGLPGAPAISVPGCSALLHVQIPGLGEGKRCRRGAGPTEVFPARGVSCGRPLSAVLRPVVLRVGGVAGGTVCPDPPGAVGSVLRFCDYH